MLPDLTPQQAAAFWARAHQSGNCLLWTGSIEGGGYGLVHIGGRAYRAHRVAYALRHGPIPPCREICHRCDIRSCVAPAHLWLGSTTENQRDKKSKGRHRWRPVLVGSARQLTLWPGLSTEERLWSRLDRSGACWVWTGSRTPAGYGHISVGGRPVYTHRLAYEIAYGPVPDGQFVLHACDNPPCCNPAHLRAGTRADNIRDGQDRGRIHRANPRQRVPSRRLRGKARGERHHKARLTEDAIRTIRARYAAGARQVALAAAFGVRQATISTIVRREAWTHVD